MEYNFIEIDIGPKITLVGFIGPICYFTFLKHTFNSVSSNYNKLALIGLFQYLLSKK